MKWKIVIVAAGVFLSVFGFFFKGFCADTITEVYSKRSGQNTITEVYSKGSGQKDQRDIRIAWLPIIFYSSETRLVGGGVASFFLKKEPERRTSSIAIMGFYTMNRQFSFGLSPEFYWKDGKYKFSSGIGYMLWPTTFYGIGNNTNKGDIEYYTIRLFNVNLSLQRKIYSSLYVGAKYHYFHSELTETEEGGVLAGGTVAGSEGGGGSGMGIVAAWDSRDDNIYPESGSYHQFRAIFYGPALGGDYRFNSYFIDMRYFQPLFSSHVLAFRGVVGIITGDPPFQMLNSLGVYLRGYNRTRFVDKHLGAFQAEYRLPLFWRLGLVGFAGFGQVAHSHENIAFNTLKPSAGIGIRFAMIPDKKINLRFDFARGKDDFSFDFSLMEAF